MLREGEERSPRLVLNHLIGPVWLGMCKCNLYSLSLSSCSTRLGLGQNMAVMERYAGAPYA